MKLCSKCQIKPSRAISQAWCADCHAAYHREYRKTHPEKWADTSEKRKRSNKQRVSKYRLAHPVMMAAHNAIWYAVKTGKLVRPNQCSQCLKSCKPHAHHHRGHEHKLDIIWLCGECHRLAHRQNSP